MRRIALFGLLAVLVAPSAFADETAVCADAAENGQKVRDKGHFTEAHELFTKCARKQCPRLIRDDCVNFLEQLRKRQPSIVIRVSDAGHHDITSFKVLKDGKLLLDKASGNAIDTDPGEVKLHVEADGYKPRDLPLVVADGEQRRLVEIVLTAVGAPEPGADKPAPPPLLPAAQFSNGPSTATLFLGGVGVAAFGVYGVFQGLGLSGRSDLEKDCPRGHPCPDEAATVRAKFQVAAVGLGVGIAGLGVATILYFANDYHHKKDPSSAVRFTPNGFVF